MKAGDFYGIRGKQVFLTLVAMLCTSLLIWAWDKTPLVASIFPQQGQLTIMSEDNMEGTNHPKFSSPMRDTSGAGHRGQPSEAREVSSSIKVPAVQSNARNMKKDENVGVISGENSTCNYAKGRWVPDDRRPLYSGFGCKQWLSPMWACRLTQRKDFSYESFRWQPDACRMPEFVGSKFLKRMRDKTIAFVGDSLGRTQFQSLMCMVTGGNEKPEVLDVGIEFGLVKAPGAKRPDGWAYRFPDTNTTILYYWSASLCELEPLNISGPPTTTYALHLDRPATFLSRYLDRFDVLILNTGHHWNRGKFDANRWNMYAGGVPARDRNLSDMANAKNFTVHSIVGWVDLQLSRRPLLRAFFRTLSPRHYVNGDWNTGGSCGTTTPLLHGNRVSRDDGSGDPTVEGAARGTGVGVLDITALSQLRDEGHVSNNTIKAASGIHDCLHWCLPGIPDTWNEILSAQL